MERHVVKKEAFVEYCKRHEIGEEEEVEGRIVGDRTAMLAEIMKNLPEKDK